MARIKRIEHHDRLELVGHLDELRTRLIVALAAFGVALGLCLWQNHQVLAFFNQPLHGQRLLTLGVTEPFTTTLMLSAYSAILLALPVILYQAYAFVLPAFSPRERRIALPLILMVPVLFVAGAAFAYLVVAPSALHFLLHFNQHQFNTQLRARDYYGFLSMLLIATGVVFQVPVGILALTRLGVTTPSGLRAKRRYAILGAAVIAAALPGVDPVSMLLEMVPLVLLYEFSILLAVAFGTPAATAEPSPSAGA
ncbi:MAG: twin-arginine translocase subunit TatC [Thermoleophilaceae bacterium]